MKGGEGVLSPDRTCEMRGGTLNGGKTDSQRKAKESAKKVGKAEKGSIYRTR